MNNPNTGATNQELHAKAKSGMKMLMGRQVVLQVLTFAGGVVLARKLGPGPFGLYVIASFLVGTFALIGDFGLAPSFIQRKADLTDRDLQVGFTLQQVLTTLIVLFLWIAAPWLAHFYPKAPPATVWLVRSLSFNLFLTSWRSMSALQLERHLQYNRLAKIEILESLLYQGTAVGLAVTGHGPWSFVCAVIVSGLVGTTLVYAASPWPIRFAFDRKIASEILRFGVPFQLQTISNSFGGWASPLLVGSLVGPQGVGFLSWASSNGKKPLILVDNVMRVAFPHFSRLQDDPAEVERTLTRYLTYLSIPAGLWFSAIFVAGRPLVEWIYSAKWLPAVPALILCAAALSFDVASWVIAVTLNSQGRVAFTTRLILARSVLSVLGSVLLVIKIGFLGVPIAYLIASAITVPWLLGGLGTGAPRRVLGQLVWLVMPCIGGICLGEAVSRLPLSPLPLRAALEVATVAALYGATAWVTGPEYIRRSLRAKIGGRMRWAKAPLVAAE